jgi:hypothetical protein
MAKRSLIERLEAIDTTHGDAKEAAQLLYQIYHDIPIVIEALELPLPPNPTWDWLQDLNKTQKNLANLLRRNLTND